MIGIVKPLKSHVNCRNCIDLNLSLNNHELAKLSLKADLVTRNENAMRCYVTVAGRILFGINETDYYQTIG